MKLPVFFVLARWDSGRRRWRQAGVFASREAATLSAERRSPGADVVHWWLLEFDVAAEIAADLESRRALDDPLFFLEEAGESVS